MSTAPPRLQRRRAAAAHRPVAPCGGDGPTVAGTIYYVQIGGFLGDPAESFPYGTLHVSLR
ncbi:MAG: hypothetical protein ABIZ72_10865 [Candidatus Limnocylindrales bacterium]